MRQHALDAITATAPAGYFLFRPDETEKRYIRYSTVLEVKIAVALPLGSADA